MTLFFVWAAGACLGLSFDLFAVVVTAAIIAPVAFFSELHVGLRAAFWVSVEALICLQIGYACGLASLLLGARVYASQPSRPKRPSSVGSESSPDRSDATRGGNHQ